MLWHGHKTLHALVCVQREMRVSVSGTFLQGGKTEPTCETKRRVSLTFGRTAAIEFHPKAVSHWSPRSCRMPRQQHMHCRMHSTSRMLILHFCCVLQRLYADATSYSPAQYTAFTGASPALGKVRASEQLAWARADTCSKLLRVACLLPAGHIFTTAAQA